MLGGQSDFGSMQFHTFEKTAKNMLLNVDYKESRQREEKDKITMVMQLMHRRHECKGKV